jgi:hypothetical protein
MKLVRTGIITAAVYAALLSTAAVAAPPGKQDSSFDQAAENASRYSDVPLAGSSYGWANPNSLATSPGARYAPIEPSYYGYRHYGW